MSHLAVNFCLQTANMGLQIAYGNITSWYLYLLPNRNNEAVENLEFETNYFSQLIRHKRAKKLTSLQLLTDIT